MVSSITSVLNSDTVENTTDTDDSVAELLSQQ
jgi:hypothetical protein